MIVQCPHCGKTIDLGRVTGRKPLDITVKNVCGALQEHGTVAAAAKELGCSRGYIYKVLKASGMKLTG
jgi:molybdenum-dependent DNA-binding transcriptional regulator ModE